MKKIIRGMSVLVVVLAVSLLCNKNEVVKAEIISDNVTHEIVFNEFDAFNMNDYGDTVVIKFVLKESGWVKFDFGQEEAHFDARLFDESGALLGRGSTMFFDTIVTPKAVGIKNNLGDGTYYLELKYNQKASKQAYTFFSEFIPNSSANLEICINVKQGKSIQLGTILDNCKDKNIKWSSSNKKVATVSSNGKVKGIKKGTVTIKAYNSVGLVSKIKVKVIK